jgi:nicotinamide mononucleotide transporter
MLIKNWNIFEVALFYVSFAVALCCTLTTDNSILSFLTFLTGMICVVFAAKGMIFTYHTGLINSLLYSYIAYTNGLFGEVYLNLFFYVPMNVVGIILWRNKLKDMIVVMRKLSLHQTIYIVAGALFSIFLLGYLLALNPAQNTPYIDASTNVLGVMATILMVMRYREQWLLYISLNVLTIIMWVLRTINQGNDGQMMIIMWSAFLVNSVYGYYNWSKGARNTAKTVSLQTGQPAIEPEVQS